jgi:hypothetical protein
VRLPESPSPTMASDRIGSTASAIEPNAVVEAIGSKAMLTC